MISNYAINLNRPVHANLPCEWRILLVWVAEAKWEVKSSTQLAETFLSHFSASPAWKGKFPSSKLPWKENILELHMTGLAGLHVFQTEPKH